MISSFFKTYFIKILISIFVILLIFIYLYILNLKDKLEVKNAQIVILMHEIAYFKQLSKKYEFEAEWNTTEPTEQYKEYEYEIFENNNTNLNTIEFIKLQ